MKKMKAAVLYEQNKPLVIEELAIPELQTGQVLVKIVASGICKSQLNEIRGRKGPDKYLPHTLGHEGAGVVESVGSGVEKVIKGDHVVLSWIKGKGINAGPPVYFSGRQKINSGQLSTFNEYTVTAENRVTPIDKRMPFAEAALLGCAASTGIGSVMNIAKLKKGESIAVFGCGGIGLSAIMAASVLAAGRIIAVDIDDHKLELAKALGASEIINARKDGLNKIEADYAIESAGRAESMQQAFCSVKRGGGKAIIVGNLPAGSKIEIDPFELICGREIVGSWGGSTNPDQDIPKYVDLFLSGKLEMKKMLGGSYRLDQINQAVESLEQGSYGRTTIKFAA
ncbi:zinc-binding dehydrogenase [Candidatus Margulisiibacteriota bacterium]